MLWQNDFKMASYIQRRREKEGSKVLYMQAYDLIPLIPMMITFVCLVYL